MVKIEGSLDELRELMGISPSNRSVPEPKDTPAQKSDAPKKGSRKLSAWNRYVANPRNKILHKSGPRKGRLNLKAMARKFRSANKSNRKKK